MKIKGFLKILFVLTLFLTFAPVNATFADDASSGGTSIITSATSSAGGDMQQVLCNVLAFVTGGIGKTIASFIIIGVGLGFFTGKVSWGVLIGVTLGISAMFGAPAIITAITGGTADWCK